MGAAGDRTFLGIATCGFDSDANQIANSARLVRGRFVYTYGGLRALAGWKPASFKLRVDGVEHALYGYTVSSPTPPCTAADVARAGRLAERWPFDVVMIADMPKTKFLRLLPTVFREPRRLERGHDPARKHHRDQQRQTVHALRRRRSARSPAGDPASLPGAVRVCSPRCRGRCRWDAQVAAQ